MTEEKQKIVSAQEFLLVNKQGDTRSRLGFYGEDSPRIRLIDSSLCERISIGIASDNPGVNILNPNASMSIAIGSVFPSVSGVMICDDKGAPGITMLVQMGGQNNIDIYDTDEGYSWKSSDYK